MTLLEKQKDLTARFLVIDDAHERLAAITARGKKWPAPVESDKTDDHRVPGCVSRVWLVGEVVEGRCRWRMDAESPIVKGLVSLLCEVTEGATLVEAAAFQSDILTALGLDRQLSPTRLNGLEAVAQTIRAFGKHHLAP